MSRIHDALLRAQKEQGAPAEPVDLESIALEALQNHCAGVDPGSGTRPMSTVSAPKDGSTAAADTPLHLHQCSWQPQKQYSVFREPELARGVEEFRLLRSRLLRERSNRHLKVVLISGATPEEGKTFVAINLAVAMARHPGTRVLLIDADLRRSSIHAALGMESKPGLSEYLSGTKEEMPVVRQTPESQLCVVTAGENSDMPIELLHSPRMQRFMEKMCQSFDWIFIDSPPATVVSDSVVLSEFCDGVLMVISAGTDAAVARKSLKQMGEKVLGVVLNRTEYDAGVYGYQAYQKRVMKTRNSRAIKS